MGKEPSWYPLLRAARYLRVAPWELAQQPAWWVNIALTAQSAEAHAQHKKSARKAGSNANGGRT